MKKTTIAVVALVLLSFLSSYNFTVIVSADDWVIDGDTVYINTTDVYLSATPHTIESEGWVEFEFKLKSGPATLDVDFIWGFNKSEMSPRYPQVWRNYTHNLIGWHWIQEYATMKIHNVTNYTNLGIENYSNYSVDYGNENNTKLYRVNNTDPHQNSTLIVAFTQFNVNGSTYTLSGNHTFYKPYIYQKSFWDWWRIPLNLIEKINYNYENMTTWYLIEKNVDRNVTYHIRAWIKFPHNGLNPNSGKYWFAVKPSAKTIQQAIADGQFYALDPWFSEQYNYRKLITIDSSITDNSLINFTYYYNLSSDSDLANNAQDDGDDIIFIDYFDNSTQLSHEIEYFNETTGELDCFIKIPYLYSYKDTKLWMYYGNPNATNQQDVEGTWDSNYTMVQHINETSGNCTDSTSFDNDGTPGANLDTGIDAFIDGGAYFNGTVGESDAITFTNTTHNFNFTDSFTFSFWMNTTSSGEFPFAKGNSNNGYRLETLSDGDLDVEMRNSVGLHLIRRRVNANIRDGNWHHIVITYNGSLDVSGLIVYVDGNIPTTAASTDTVVAGDILSNDYTFYIGRNSGGTAYWYEGWIDEFRVSNNVRNASWINASYRNQYYPDNYVTSGTQQSADINIVFDSPKSDNTSRYSSDFTLDVNVSSDAGIGYTNYSIYKNLSVEVWSWKNITDFNTSSTSWVNVTGLEINVTNPFRLNQSFFIVWTITANCSANATANFSILVNNTRVANSTRYINNNKGNIHLHHIFTCCDPYYIVKPQMKTNNGTLYIYNSTLFILGTNDSNSSLAHGNIIVDDAITTTSTAMENMTGTRFNITLPQPSKIFILHTFNGKLNAPGTIYTTVMVNGTDQYVAERGFGYADQWGSVKAFFLTNDTYPAGTYEIIGRWSVNSSSINATAINTHISAIVPIDEQGNFFNGNYTNVTMATTNSTTFEDINGTEINITMNQTGYVMVFAGMNTEVNQSDKCVDITVNINNDDLEQFCRGHRTEGVKGSVGFVSRTPTRLSPGVYPVKIRWKTEPGVTATARNIVLMAFTTTTSQEKYEVYQMNITNEATPGALFYVWNDTINTSQRDKWSDGNYRLDVYGNNSAVNKTSSVYFYFASEAPVITLVSPVTYNRTQNLWVNFTYRVSSSVNITNASLEINDAVVNTTTNITKDIDQYINYTFVDYGTYKWNILCYDENNRSAQASPARFIVVGNSPVVTTNTSTNVEETSATLNAYLSEDGGEPCTVRFEYGKTTSYGTNTTGQTKTEGQTVLRNIFSLSHGDLYHYRSYAENSFGSSTGSDTTFLTKPLAPATLTASPINSTTINLTWIKGTGANKTYIERNASGQTVWGRGLGTLIYNGTGIYFEDTGLSQNITYYYQAWGYTEWGSLHQYSDNNKSANAVTNTPPTKPLLPLTPENNSDYESVYNQYMNVTVTDADGGTLNVSFYWGNGTLIGTDLNVSVDTNASLFLPSVLSPDWLNHNTIYYWYVNVSDGIVNVTSPTWSFNTSQAWDINEDRNVSYLDASLFVADYGKTGYQNGELPADIDNDGDVDYLDASLLIAHYGETY